MMNSEIVTKVLIYAAGAMAPLITSKVAHTMAPIAARVYDNVLKGNPLPPLTEVVLIKFAGSEFSVGMGLALTIFILMGVVTMANPTRRSEGPASTMQIFLAFVGPFVSTVYMGVVLIAAMLPLTPMGHVLIESVKQNSAERGR